MFDLVLGTGNAKKLHELQWVVPKDRIRVTSLSQIPGALDVDETGTTFFENARLKACEQAKHLSRWVLADDSGLEVDALGGQPGVYSARYAGTHGDDAGNNTKLLAELDGVPPEKRGAAFVCVLCLSDRDGNVVFEAEGRCRGRIGEAASGTAGFGYDPLFVIREYRKTFAELDFAVKRAISHRSIAMRKFASWLEANPLV